MRSAALAALALGSADAAGKLKLSWKDCGDSSTHGHITSLTPDELTIGAKTSLAGKGSLDEAIPAASYTVSAKALGVPVFSHNGDACKAETIKLPLGVGEIDMKGFKCPMSAGPAELDLDVSLAAAIPAKIAKLDIDLTAKASNGDKALCVSIQTAPETDYEGMWLQYKTDYNKDYNGNGEDEQKRFSIFKKNVDIIEEHNAKKLSYWLGVNEFADLTWEEFSSTHLGYKAGSAVGGLTKVPFPNITDVADSIDWVAKGAVTPVKNQQRCGSCWAFSSTGSLEGAMFVATGKLISLSEEDLVQCNSITDHGCQGGLMDNAFNWVQQNGICSETAYPYTSGGGVTGSCQKGCSPVVSITGHTDVPSRDESALQAAVSKQPVSVAIEADKSAFQLYSGGILDNSACGTNLDHGVLVVGYGTDGKDYWKVKNSWGASWGEQGYIRMVRNKNQCGISQQPSYPTGAKSAGLEVEGGTLKLDWTDCGDSSYHAKVTALAPTSISIGDKTTVTGSGKVDESVTGGAFTITAKFGPITEHYDGEVCSPKTFNLPLGLGSVTWDGIKCPVSEGAVDVGVDVKLASIIPASAAKGTISIKATGASKENLICLNLDVSKAASANSLIV